MSLVRLGAATLCFAFSLSAQAQFIALDGSGNPENFDTLANSGTGSNVPNGWYFNETSASHPTPMRLMMAQRARVMSIPTEAAQR